MKRKPELGELIRQALPPVPAPESLHDWARARAREAVEDGELAVAERPRREDVAPLRRRTAWRGTLYAAGLVVAASLGYAGRALVARDVAARSARQALVAQLVDNHVQSLAPGHLMDVVSTDQHTVKPWFIGRADFAPRVKALDSVGFPLLGGRLAYVNGHPAAALVYGRRKHIINLYMWRDASSADDGGPLAVARQAGFSVAHWNGDGLSFWAVTDAAPEDLAAFRAAYMRP